MSPCWPTLGCFEQAFKLWRLNCYLRLSSLHCSLSFLVRVKQLDRQESLSYFQQPALVEAISAKYALILKTFLTVLVFDLKKSCLSSVLLVCSWSIHQDSNLLIGWLCEVELFWRMFCLDKNLSCIPVDLHCTL